jgi:predicted XRE-type DNA-binding protein
MESEEAFYRVLCATLSRDLGHTFDRDRDWDEDLGPNLSMGLFLRSLVAMSEQPLVWFIDEADRLFASPLGSDFFGLVRSWHNSRATDPRGPWSRLTVAIGYATEAHLFIANLNQSPFNVGRPVPMSMFSVDEVHALNERYGRPLTSETQQSELHGLVGGQPYLTRRAFDALVTGEHTPDSLFENADRDDGPFGDHLKRILLSVTQLPFVWEALQTSVAGASFPDSAGLQRLVAAGVLVHRPPHEYKLACELYRRYLSRHFREEVEKPSVPPIGDGPTIIVKRPAEGLVEASVVQDVMAELVRLRKKRKMGQSPIAEALGVTQSRVSQIENVKGDVRMETVLNYARAIGANVCIAPDK